MGTQDIEVLIFAYLGSRSALVQLHFLYSENLSSKNL